MSPERVRLDELVAVTEADVYKQGRLAGRLVRDHDTVEFSYDRGWEPSDGPIASTLPVRGGTVRAAGGAVPSFFAGQLPEGRRLSALRRATKTSPDDELTLLLGVGDDVVGDVQVLPSGVPPGTVHPLITIDDPAAVRFADLVRSLDSVVDRVGIPGIQTKASAAMVNLPVGLSGSHFILKIDPPEFPHLVENEAFFLDAARRSGLLFNLDRMARLKAIEGASSYGISTHVFINFNPSSIYDPEYCLRSTLEAVKRSGLSPEKIVFEVTESDEVRDGVRLREILSYYRESGFGVALDDLGSGYGSLNLLASLRPDFVKLDIGLAEGLDHDPYRAAISRKLIELADELGVTVIAEGIETEEQWRWLADNGAEYAQGYLFARPASPPPIPAPVYAWSPRPLQNRTV